MPFDQSNTERVVFNPFANTRGELTAGLLAAQAQISPKFFYNRLGSKLFESICELEEYYPARCEAQIFAKFESEIREQTGEGVTLIDLGAGNCEKASTLFRALKPQQYVPIDISSELLDKAASALKAHNPEISIHPLALDFSESLLLPPQIRQERRLFFYPGSSLGNFTPPQAFRFLRRLRCSSPSDDGAILTGIDLAKDPARLVAAYDDKLGVTAAFNRNVLLHVNKLLGTDFDPSDWRHRALFNANHSRIEMHLEALNTVKVHWPKATRVFAAGETIHTENSYKYTKLRFFTLLRKAGFCETASWTDADNSYLVCHAKAI